MCLHNKTSKGTEVMSIAKMGSVGPQADNLLRKLHSSSRSWGEVGKLKDRTDVRTEFEE